MDIPVLFICFARPEYARRTFEAIKKNKPHKLYFYSNKGREEYGDEMQRNDEVRNLINEVDWNCDLHKWFREECVNVYESVHSAIDWLFNNEEKGIVLEEDCVAAPAFFDFQEKMLNKFQFDNRIFMVCGSNFFEDYNPHSHDYLFTRYPMGWGWGSWRDRWQAIDWDHFSINDMLNEGVCESLYSSDIESKWAKKHWKEDILFLRRTLCWDGIFTRYFLSRGSFGIMPAHNLIQSIGISGAHFHKKSGNDYLHKPIKFLDLQYTICDEPHYMLPDAQYDSYLFKNHIVRSRGYRHILYKIKDILSNIFK